MTMVDVNSFILAIALCEVVTELVVGSSLTARWRGKMLGPDEKNPKLFGILMSCGYCLSVWVALGLTYALRIKGLLPILGVFEPLAIALIIHRASNILHVMVSFAFKALQGLAWKLMK